MTHTLNLTIFTNDTLEDSAMVILRSLKDDILTNQEIASFSVAKILSHNDPGTVSLAIRIDFDEQHKDFVNVDAIVEFLSSSFYRNEKFHSTNLVIFPTLMQQIL